MNFYLFNRTKDYMAAIIAAIYKRLPPDSRFNFVDVGCCRGTFLGYVDWMRRLAKIPGPLFSIGIDPIWGDINHKGLITRKLRDWRGKYDHLVEVAIDDTDDHLVALNRYKEDDDGCSSLLVANPKHNYSIGWGMERFGTKEVLVTRLGRVLTCLQFEGDIHFLKIDTQGKDVSTVRSAGSYLDRVWFVQIESVVDGVEPLYLGQSCLSGDVEVMGELGFVPVFGVRGREEQDTCFINRRHLLL